MDNYNFIREDRFKTQQDKRNEEEDFQDTLNFLKNNPQTQLELCEITTINNIDILQTYKNFLIQKGEMDGEPVEGFFIEIFNEKLEKAYLQDKRYRNNSKELLDVLTFQSKILVHNLTEYEAILKDKRNTELLEPENTDNPYTTAINNFNKAVEILFNKIEQLISSKKCSNVLRVLFMQNSFQTQKSINKYIHNKKVKSLLSEYKNYKIEKVIEMFNVIKYYDRYEDESIYRIEVNPNWELFNMLKQSKTLDCMGNNQNISLSIASISEKNKLYNEIESIQNYVHSMEIQNFISNLYLYDKLWKPEELEHKAILKDEINEFLKLMNKYFDLIKTCIDKNYCNNFYKTLYEYRQSLGIILLKK